MDKSRTSSLRENKRKGEGSLRWRPRLISRSRSAPATVSATEDTVPDLITLEAPSPPPSPSSSGRWRLFKKPVSLPNLETTEFSFDTERSLDDPFPAIAKKPNTSLSPQHGDALYKVLRTALSTIKRARKLLEDESFPSSPLFWAAAVGLLLPSSWIFYGLILYIFAKVNKVVIKWTLYFWDDHEAVKFRRTISQCWKLVSHEMELTLNGNYSRQVVASYVYYASTAPGESSIGAFMRYKMNSINMHVIDEIDQARDRFYGYKKAPRIYSPFS